MAGARRRQLRTWIDAATAMVVRLGRPHIDQSAEHRSSGRMVRGDDLPLAPPSPKAVGSPYPRSLPPTSSSSLPIAVGHEPSRAGSRPGGRLGRGRRAARWSGGGRVGVGLRAVEAGGGQRDGDGVRDRGRTTGYRGCEPPPEPGGWRRGGCGWHGVWGVRRSGGRRRRARPVGTRARWRRSSSGSRRDSRRPPGG
jgi:hypothetical protein